MFLLCPHMLLNCLPDNFYFLSSSTSQSTLKSTENCVCILHNLSYQIESELPKKNDQVLTESRQDLDSQPKTLGCFSYRSAKITEVISLHINGPWQHKRRSYGLISECERTSLIIFTRTCSFSFLLYYIGGEKHPNKSCIIHYCFTRCASVAAVMLLSM